MPRPYIDFISEYCDRWCERCAFTERCSNFAVTSALAMCDGNFEAAIELAIGPPRRPGGKPQQSLHERMAEALGDYEPTEKELEKIGREIDARRERIAKIMQALDGRDECPGGDFRNGDPIQSDWNGSAKVATISIARSERAWRIIAAATGDEAAGVLATGLATLGEQMSREFPHAMEFRRPGFDEAAPGERGS